MIEFGLPRPPYDFPHSCQRPSGYFIMQVKCFRNERQAHPFTLALGIMKSSRGFQLLMLCLAWILLASILAKL